MTNNPEAAGKKYRDGNAVTYFEAKIVHHSGPPPVNEDFPAKLDLSIGSMKQDNGKWTRSNLLLSYPTQSLALPNFRRRRPFGSKPAICRVA